MEGRRRTTPRRHAHLCSRSLGFFSSGLIVTWAPVLTIPSRRVSFHDTRVATCVESRTKPLYRDIITSVHRYRYKRAASTHDSHPSSINNEDIATMLTHRDGFEHPLDEYIRIIIRRNIWFVRRSKGSLNGRFKCIKISFNFK